MIPTLKNLEGGPFQANFGGASLETFSGETQLKNTLYYDQESGKVLLIEALNSESVRMLSITTLH